MGISQYESWHEVSKFFTPGKSFLFLFFFFNHLHLQQSTFPAVLISCSLYDRLAPLSTTPLLQEERELGGDGMRSPIMLFLLGPLSTWPGSDFPERIELDGTFKRK